MGKRALLCSLAFASILLAACRTYEPPEPVYLKIAGSTSMQPLLEELAEAYAKRHRHVTIEVEGGGSRRGMELARRRQVDLGTCSRQLREGEKLWSIPMALDGIAIVVHPTNMVEGLTLLQLRDIFYGRIWNWRDVGGQDREIAVISREEGSGTRAAFEEMVMGGERVTPAAVVMPGSREVVEYVGEHPRAIGYVSMGFISQVKALKIEGLLPTPESVGKGYHLVRPFLLLAAEEPTGEAKAFVDFVLGPRGQSIVGRRYGRVR